MKSSCCVTSFVSSNSCCFIDIHFSPYRSRIAKNAMSLLETFDVNDQIPAVFFNFYGRIAWCFEPFQVCLENLRRAFETALSQGSHDMGFFISIHVIKTAIFTGEKLTSLLKEIDYYLHLSETYKNVVARNLMLNFRETVSVLIDNGEATSIEAKPSFGDINNKANKMRETMFFHKAIQAFWIGYTDRCRHYGDKCMPILAPLGQFNTYILKFYHGKGASVTYATYRKGCLTQSQLITCFFCSFALLSSTLRTELKRCS